ncbi:MAG: oligosaccharide flippase family protein [Firmicutes bacterium]|nr:oligosaccharide flippase family protein [Bacillota bacterium]
MFFITLSTAGIKLASMRIISEELAAKNTSGAKLALKQCLTYALILGTFSGLALFFSSQYIAAHWIQGKISASPFIILSIALPFMAISSVLNGYFYALRKLTKTASSQVIEEVAQIAAAAFLLSIFLPKGIEYAIIAIVLGTTVSEIISCSYLFATYKLDKYREENSIVTLGKIGQYTHLGTADYKKKIFNIAVPVSVTSYIRAGLSTLKQVLIPIRLQKSGLSSEAAFSQYGLINGMVLPIIMFPSSLLSVFSELLIPEFSDYNYLKSYKSIKYVMKRAFKITLIFSLIWAGIFFVFANQISLILYHNLDSAIYLKILSFVVIFIYLDSVIDNMLKGLNKQVSVMAVNVIDLIVTTSLIYFLLPLYGVGGYIVIMFVSELLNFILSLWILLKSLFF